MHTKREARERRKRWDRGKGDPGEQFHFTLNIHRKRNVTSEFHLSHVKTYLYTWYHFISQNASVLMFMLCTFYIPGRNTRFIT